MIRRAALGALLLLSLGTSANAATFTIRPQAGFDDATPVTPTPGNPATTLGQARLNVLKEAGRVWGSLLVSSVPILVDATFAPLDCDATTATAATGGPTGGFTISNRPNVVYVSALADALTSTDRFGAMGMSGNADIKLTLNSKVNGDPLCLGASRFYLGLDHNPGFNDQDLLGIVLHEFAHGLGFLSLVNLDSTKGTVGDSMVSSGILSSYDQFVFDEVLGQPWTQLTSDQRRVSASRNRQVAWDGASVKANLSFLTAGVTSAGRLQLFAPSTIVPGSSISHFESAATPDLLMEPSADSIVAVTDVTVCALQDIGWQVTRCPDFTLSSPPSVSSPPPVVTTPPPTGTGSPPMTSGRKKGGGGALYLPFLLALAGIVPLRARLRRRQRR